MFTKKTESTGVTGLLMSVAEVLALLGAIAGASAVIGYLSAFLISPQWLAPGYPSFYRYPKNVEIKAILLAAAVSVPISLVLARLPSVYKFLSSGVLFLLGLWVAYGYLNFESIVSWAAPTGTLVILFVFLNYFLSKDTVQRPALLKAWPFISVAALGTALLFLESIYGAYFFDSRLDLHHFGERFTSALDFLNGGKPFETFFWPHGLHDTGLTALFFHIFSADLPTMFLAQAAANSLGVITILLLCVGMGLGYYSLLVAAAAVLLNDMLFVPTYALLLPVIVSFLLFSRYRKAPGYLAAGAVAFIAYIYRIDYGLYGILSVFGYTIYLFACAVISKKFALIKGHAASIALYSIGFSLAAVFSYLVFGFPGPKWYSIVMFTLPKYMADSTGFPYPLPVTWTSVLDYTGYTKQIGLLYLAAVFGIISISARHLYRQAKTGLREYGFFVLLLFLVAFSIRTAIGRSAEDHILQFFGFAYLVLILAISNGVILLKINRWLKGSAVASLFIFMNFWTGSFGMPTRVPHGQIVSESAQILSEFGSPKPAQCSNGMFSARNLANPNIFAYDRAVCSARVLLESRGIKNGELLVVHSASLVYPSLGFKLPTKYYCLGWAITHDMQRELVSELEKSGVKAVLRIRTSEGIRGLETYDISDAIRVPIYSEWFGKRYDVENPVYTELGEVFFMRE